MRSGEGERQCVLVKKGPMGNRVLFEAWRNVPRCGVYLKGGKGRGQDGKGENDDMLASDSTRRLIDPHVLFFLSYLLNTTG